MKKITFVLTLVSVGLLLGVGRTHADQTPINPTSNLVSAGGILDQIYGLGNLQRVDDSIDQIWLPDHGNATVVAKFSNLSQNFGYIPDLNLAGFDDDYFRSLFTVPGATNGINLGGPFAESAGYFSSFMWALSANGEPLWTSLQSQNDDGLDHMVTWQLITSPGTWVIAWEESFGGGDHDYNDLVLEVTLFPVPDPAPPVAVANAIEREALSGEPITFEHSGSFHMDIARTLVSFRWDFDEDGIWDVETYDINETPSWIYYDTIVDGDVVVHRVTLEVEDDQGQIDSDALGATVSVRTRGVVAVPTLSQWGMMVWFVLLASSGFWLLKRRNRAA